MADKSLLIIDDDEELTALLSEYLTPQGYRLTIAHDGNSGLQLATGAGHFDLILLDVMLPGIDGFEVLKRLRRTHLTPVLMLTAKGDDFDRIFGLELGADDYLPKPFNPRELSARVKAIVRRLEFLPTSSAQQPIRVDGLLLDPAIQQVTYKEQVIELTGTEFAMLHLLMANQGRLVSKNDLSEKVLGRKLSAFDRSIDMHVSNLRRKLQGVCPQERIKTLRGAGYMLLEVRS
ncbi:response regulator transcription factor [Aliiglaciecola sp. CAU 1673]|uniref:response regulator transcription factor n=1 Tax=Aliiglaciecola sp. CAU 1673 TaxID=3032595 RepID=UPI0023DADF28|nr:response regulator transcription factor [Aliiglaciecola sp. CAU 1673]MDF2178694.1 response regulator transcription factor [Aliiglaciecola sp. CAU 1673]